jgi:hypothetical protein
LVGYVTLWPATIPTNMRSDPLPRFLSSVIPNFFQSFAKFAIL